MVWRVGLPVVVGGREGGDRIKQSINRIPKR